MKKANIITTIITAVFALSVITVNGAEIPRESASFNADEQAIQITENIIGGIIDEVHGGLGYTLAVGRANTLIRKAVIKGETGGYGYGLLSAIVQNAIRTLCDMSLRPEVYKQAEEEMKVLLADIISEVENDMDYGEAVKQAYIAIYQSVNPEYVPEITVDKIYLDIPVVDTLKFNRAKYLLLQAKQS